MKLQGSRILTFAALAATLLSGSTAQAQQNFSYVNDLSETRVLGLSDNGGTNFFQGYVGRYKGRFDTGSVFNIFCVDLTHEIHAGDQYLADTNYRVADPAGALSGAYYTGGMASALTSTDYHVSSSLSAAEKQRRANAVAYLAESYLSASLFSGASGSTSTLSNLVAVNLAIWDINEDGGDGLNAGSVRGDSSAVSSYGSLSGYFEQQAIAQASVARSLSSSGPTAYWIQSPRGTNYSHLQDYVYLRPSVSPSAAVPEPGTVGLLTTGGMMLGGLAVRRRRSSKKTN